MNWIVLIQDAVSAFNGFVLFYFIALNSIYLGLFLISLFQAATQIQEITLTFVPKIVAILLVVAFSGPYIGGQISSFSNVVFERIEHGF